MLLLANGCSHTAGAEIEFSLQGECYNKAWPIKLANSLGIQHKNLSISGASDDRVVRTTIEYIAKLKQKSDYDPSNLFVIISWPGLHRTELFKTTRDERGFWDNGWMPLVSGNEETYKKQSSKSAFSYYKMWVIRQNNLQASIKFYSNVLLLQNLLIANKIKYLFWNSCKTISDNNLFQYYNELNHKRFPFILEEQFSYVELLEANGFKHSPYAKWGHYGEDAQDWFANYLSEYIQVNKLI